VTNISGRVRAGLQGFSNGRAVAAQARFAVEHDAASVMYRDQDLVLMAER
jgi:hypothetical protein